MEKEGLNLSEQMDFVEFYKDVQENHNVTEKYFVEQYREEIENNLTDVNIKKKATEIVDQIESDLKENGRLQDEEYAEQEKEGQEEPQFYFLDPAEDEEVEENEPLHVMTAAEKEAMDALSMRESDFVSLEHIIESSTLNTPNTAALKATEGINTAKEGLNTLKNGIATRIENVDAEKLDEQWQNFWLMTFSILKGFLSVATTVAVAFYKIPAKRHYKKKLDYTINETTGKDLKRMMEIQQNEMKHRFFVDWLPKLILLLSAVLIYNSVWNVGLIASGIGFVYYMMTYLTFDYGGSRLLNVLADNMYNQNIRLKDAYYNNILVLYRYFNEFQSAFGVTIDEKRGINITEDPDLGQILHFFINEDKNVTITSITDNRISYNKLLPHLDPYTKSAKLQEKHEVKVMLDQILLMPIKKDENVADLFASKEEYIPYFNELKPLAEARRLAEEERLAKEADDKFYAEIAKKNLSERAVNIIKFLKRESNKLSMSPHDLNGIGINGNDDYLRVRMSLNRGLTEAQAKAKLEYIGSKTGLTPKIKPTGTSSAVNLMFYLNPIMKGRAMTIAEIKSDAEKGIINLGKGTLGDYKVSIPREDEPFFLLTGAITRAGKSTIVSRILTSTAYLVDDNGFHDYQDFFIASAKPSDYMSNGFQSRGMFVTNADPIQTYQMLKFVDEFAQKRQQIFIDSSVVNIKQYNKKFPNNKLGKIMVVVDEYANILALVGKKKIETEDGKISLEDAIVQTLIKINSLHGSAGVSAMVITQSFAKNSVGRVRDGLLSHLLGYADKDVWNSIDTSQEMSNYMKTRKESFKGLFFLKSTDFRPIEGVEYESFDSGYVEIATHFIDTDDIRDSFDRTYETAAKYTNLILNAEVVSEEDENPVTLSNINDEVVEETTLESENEFVY